MSEPQPVPCPRASPHRIAFSHQSKPVGLRSTGTHRSEPGGGWVGHTVCAPLQGPGGLRVSCRAGFLLGLLVPQEKVLSLRSCSSAEPRCCFAPRGDEWRGGAWELVRSSDYLIGPPAATSSPSLFFRIEVCVLGILALLLAAQAVGTAHMQPHTALRVAWSGCVLMTTTTGVWRIGTQLFEKDAAL